MKLNIYSFIVFGLIIVILYPLIFYFSDKRIAKANSNLITYQYDVRGFLSVDNISEAANRMSRKTENLNKKYFNFNINNLIKVGFFILFYNCLFLILLNKNLIDRKQSYLFSVIFSFILFFYAMIINVIEVNVYNFELKLLSLILIFLIFYKSYKYE